MTVSTSGKTSNCSTWHISRTVFEFWKWQGQTIFSISHLVLFWKPWVWVAVTLLCVASLFLPFCLLLWRIWVLVLLPPSFPLCEPFPFSQPVPLPCLALQHHTLLMLITAKCFSSSCFHLGLFFGVCFFVIQFVVSSWGRWINTSAGWMQTWHGSRLISKINWKAVTLKPLDPEASKVGTFYTTESLFQHSEYQTRKPEM